ncbi:MAG: DUF4175 domain-containing protein, partial [Akkermansiaceae bacterium]|nr:DUF4175 domain-containing protein [Akkermansiaceae bacterium]
MNPTTTPPPVIETLQQAGAVHSRHRAAMLLLRGGLILLGSIPLLMLADVLGHFPDPVRLAGVVLFVAGALAVLVMVAFIAWWVRPPLLRIARLLEERNPALGSKLVNILQLDAASGHGESAELTRALARRAVEDASEALDLPALPPLAREPRLPDRAWWFAGLAGLLGLLTIFGGPAVRTEWLRYLDPYGDHPPFSLTRLEILKPAPTDQVLYGGGFTVLAGATGHQPKELFLTAKPADGSGGTVTLPMAARGDGTFVARLDHIVHPLELTAHTADGGSRSQRRMLSLILVPQWEAAVVRLAPPAYTGQKAREMSYRFTGLQVLEGSEIGFAVASNRPLGTGGVMLETGAGEPARFPLAPAPEGPPDTARATLVASQSGRLTFSLTDAEGNVAAEHPTATLTVTRDQPPAIALATPEEDSLVVENLTIPVAVDATDDYGLRSVRLHIGVNDRFVALDPAAFERPDVRRHRLEHQLDLAKLGAKAGDRITVFAEAIDTRPDPQVTRTVTRRLEVITEADYNKRLREQADVALIAGKYEDLLERFEQAIAEQRRIEGAFAALRERAATQPDGERDLKEFTKAFAEQHELNGRLEQMADEMEDFGRDNPVYDFEQGLHEKLREQGSAIRDSVKRQREDAERALAKSEDPPTPPTGETMQDTEHAAREQRERLQGGADRAREEITEPLADLARLHELMKDFNRFQQLAREQRDLADQAKAYQDKPQLNAEDRAALRDLGARQREQAGKLDQLARKLKHDAEAAKEKFPEAAAAAGELADQMDAAEMPGLARGAARSMLEAKAAQGHGQARNLAEEMDRLMEDAAQAGQQGVAGGLDRALRAQRGLNPGDTL